MIRKSKLLSFIGTALCTMSILTTIAFATENNTISSEVISNNPTKTYDARAGDLIDVTITEKISFKGNKNSNDLTGEMYTVKNNNTLNNVEITNINAVAKNGYSVVAPETRFETMPVNDKKIAVLIDGSDIRKGVSPHILYPGTTKSYNLSGKIPTSTIPNNIETCSINITLRNVTSLYNIMHYTPIGTQGEYELKESNVLEVSDNTELNSLAKNFKGYTYDYAIKEGETIKIYYKEIPYKTVVYADGTLVIDEHISNREFNINLHGAVEKEYPSCKEHGYVFNNKEERFWNNDYIYNIVIGSRIQPTSTAFWFQDTKAMSFDVSLIDTSNVTDMQYMFAGIGQNHGYSFVIRGLETWDTSKVTNMSHMFDYSGGYECYTQWYVAGIGYWNVQNVTDMSYMFANTGLHASTWTTGDLSNWDVRNVKNMDYMFAEANRYKSGALNIGNIANWDVRNVTSHHGFDTNNKLYYLPHFSDPYVEVMKEPLETESHVLEETDDEICNSQTEGEDSEKTDVFENTEESPTIEETIEVQTPSESEPQTEDEIIDKSNNDIEEIQSTTSLDNIPDTQEEQIVDAN